MNAHRFNRVWYTLAILMVLMAFVVMLNGIVQAESELGLSVENDLPPVNLYLPCIFKNACTPIYFDNFSNSVSGWPVGVNPPVTRAYVNGEYLMQIDEYGWFALTTPGIKATDYKAAVTVRNGTGLIYSYYGLIFGANTDLSRFYSLEINSYGNYGIYRYYDEGGELYWDDITPGGGWSEYINEGTASNRLAVERNGSTIKVYANGHLLDTVVDATYTGSLYIGLIADNFWGDPLLTYFDDFGVYPLNCDVQQVFSDDFSTASPSLQLTLPGAIVNSKKIDLVSRPSGD